MQRLPYNPYRKQLVLVALITWLVLCGTMMIVSPDFVRDVWWRNSYTPFFILLLLALFWSLWAITGRWKRSGLWTIILTTGIWLRTTQLDSIWNMMLLISFGVVWEYYWNLFD